MTGKKNNSTVQIKQIADQLGVSLSTVSIVLNNHGDSMRISKVTQKRVMEMAKELNYQPNIYARRFRKSAVENPPYIIVIFWRAEFLNDLLGIFINELYEIIKNRDINIEIVLQPFDFDNLEKYAHLLDSNHFNGAIMAGISDKDLELMENSEFDIPIVLIGRNSKKYNCVLVDDYDIGESCARLFYSRNHQTAGLISTVHKGRSSKLIELAFKETCNKIGIRIDQGWIQDCENRTFSCGYDAAKKLLSGNELPTALFILDDIAAGGIISACLKSGIHIPEDMEIISFGEKDYFKYIEPTISSIQPPIVKFAESAINMIIISLENRVNNSMLQEHNPIFTFRESCGDFIRI